MSQLVDDPKELRDTGEHWVILRPGLVVVPGDVRSFINPGHGYPEEKVHYMAYDAYATYEEFQRDMKLSGVGTIGIHVSDVFETRTQTIIAIT